jgi:hypothetical protein
MMRDHMTDRELGRGNACANNACDTWERFGINADVHDLESGLCASCLLGRALVAGDEAHAAIDGVSTQAGYLDRLLSVIEQPAAARVLVDLIEKKWRDDREQARKALAQPITQVRR